MTNKLGNIGEPITGSIITISNISNVVPVKYNGINQQYEICERSKSDYLAMICSDVHNQAVTILIGNKIDRSILIDII